MAQTQFLHSFYYTSLRWCDPDTHLPNQVQLTPSLLPTSLQLCLLFHHHFLFKLLHLLSCPWVVCLFFSYHTDSTILSTLLTSNACLRYYNLACCQGDRNPVIHENVAQLKITSNPTLPHLSKQYRDKNPHMTGAKSSALRKRNEKYLLDQCGREQEKWDEMSRFLRKGVARWDLCFKLRILTAVNRMVWSGEIISGQCLLMGKRHWELEHRGDVIVF